MGNWFIDFNKGLMQGIFIYLFLLILACGLCIYLLVVVKLSIIVVMLIGIALSYLIMLLQRYLIMLLQHYFYEGKNG